MQCKKYPRTDIPENQSFLYFLYKNAWLAKEVTFYNVIQMKIIHIYVAKHIANHEQLPLEIYEAYCKQLCSNRHYLQCIFLGKFYQLHMFKYF